MRINSPGLSDILFTADAVTALYTMLRQPHGNKQQAAHRWLSKPRVLCRSAGLG